MSPYTRRRYGPFDAMQAIKSALLDALGFILLGAVVLAAFLIAMAYASRVIQPSSHSITSAQISLSPPRDIFEI
jgi:hypothetical protein